MRDQQIRPFLSVNATRKRRNISAPKPSTWMFLYSREYAFFGEIWRRPNVSSKSRLHRNHRKEFILLNCSLYQRQSRPVKEKRPRELFHLLDENEISALCNIRIWVRPSTVPLPGEYEIHKQQFSMIFPLSETPLQVDSPSRSHLDFSQRFVILGETFD